MSEFLHDVVASAFVRDFLAIHHILYFIELFIPALYALHRLTKSNRRGKAAQYAFCFFLVAMFSVGTRGALGMVDRLSPHIYDPAIYYVESHSLLSVPWLIDFFYRISKISYSILALIYDCLLLLVIVASSSEILYAKTSVKNNLLVRFAIGGLLSIPLYIALPAVGPVYYGCGGFPFKMPDVSCLHGIWLTMNETIDRNSMPSLHATWVILCFLALRCSPLWHRVLGALYVAVTFIFTLGFGYHYLLDWVVALPLILFIRALTSDYRLPGLRLFSILFGAMNVITWIAILRHINLFINAYWFLNLLIILTIIVPIYLESQLNRAETRSFRRSGIRAHALEPA